jgi:hypothetical protein
VLDDLAQDYLRGPYAEPEGFLERKVIIINLTLDVHMKSLACVAPVWNSTEWVEKSVDLHVKRESFSLKTFRASARIYYVGFFVWQRRHCRRGTVRGFLRRVSLSSVRLGRLPNCFAS